MGSKYSAGLLAMLLALQWQFTSSTRANSITFDFGQSTSGTSPLMTAVFTDVGPNQVDLTLTAPGLSANNSVNSLYFNFNPALAPENLVFTPTGSTGGAQASVQAATDSFKTGGGGKFDIMFAFGSSTPFVAGDSLDYLITDPDGFSTADFEYLDTLCAGVSQAYAAVKIEQSSGVIVLDSAPQAVPETASSAGLLALGLAGVGLFGAKIRKLGSP